MHDDGEIGSQLKSSRAAVVLVVVANVNRTEQKSLKHIIFTLTLLAFVCGVM